MVDQIIKEDYPTFLKPYIDKYPQSGINPKDVLYVLHSTPGEYIIYITTDNKYAFETTEIYDENFTDEEKSKLSESMSEIEKLRHMPAITYFSKNTEKSINCLLAECLSFAFEKNFDGAAEHIDYTKKYITNRTVETSRKWQLTYCLIITAAILLITAILTLCSDKIAAFSDIDIQIIKSMKFTAAGAIGATLSIITKNGNQTFSCESGRMLSLLEVISRMIAAAVSCLVIILLFKLNLIFSGFFNTSQVNDAMYLLCIAAGFSERFIPTMLQNLEKKEPLAGNDN
ncbi:MAG: hypothetical protein LBM41_08210 [Ruminococcus sp.]|jgi:hypothetical protein|nr:hypothetical protein [Ruminococcus sp.]